MTNTDALLFSFLEKLREQVIASESVRLRPIIEAELRAESEAELKRLGSQTLSHKKTAEYIGVSTTTLDRLRHNRSDNFPKPIDVCGGGTKPVWLVRELDEWLVGRVRLRY